MEKRKERKILVVDDDIHYLRIYDYILLKEGYRVLGTLKPEKALRLFEEWQPDLVLTNVNFERSPFDGFQLSLRFHKMNPNVPSIIVSGHDNPSMQKKGKAVGCSEYLVKPFKVYDLVNRIKTVFVNTLDEPWENYVKDETDNISSKKVGEILIAMNALKKEDLVKVLSEQGQDSSRTFLGDYLLKNKMVSEEALMKALGIQYQLPYFSDLTGLVDHRAVDVLPKKTAYKYSIIPLFMTGDTMYVGTYNPINLHHFDEVRSAISLDKNIFPIISTKSHVAKVLKALYGPEDLEQEMTELKEMAEDSATDVNIVEDAQVVELENLAKVGRAVPAAKLANSIIFHAIREGASDVHFEKYKDVRYRIRCRIDGVLTDLIRVPVPIALKIISRFKVMANLDISNKHTPQDGRAKVSYKRKLLNLRISTLPGFDGEKLVIRILDKDNVIVPMGSLGLAGETLLTYQNAINKPQGFILVTGPTGCGKTTTLYSSLYQIGSSDKSIVTIEDPVEYRIERFNQVQVNNAKGLTFASILRSVLRQDPNIILVGEIRDEETAKIAIHSSLTGHLIFSTLHTRSSFDAVTRLVDMGIKPFLLTSSLTCVVAQRLVRRLCPACKKPYKPNSELLERLLLPDDNYTFYNPVGCPECRHLGYRGRVGVFEILNCTPTVKRLIMNQTDSEEFRKIMRKEGMRTLWDEGLARVVEGLTSVEEMLSVIQIEEA